MLTLEQRITILENKLVNEAMDPSLKEAKARFREIRTLDKKADKLCKTLIDSLRSAADQLEMRIQTDGSEEGWNIHSTDSSNLSTFIGKLSNDITSKIDKSKEAVDSAISKFEELDTFMEENDLDYDEL